MSDLRNRILPCISECLSRNENIKRMSACMNNVLLLSHIARREGLLALEEYASTLDTSNNDNAFINMAVMLIVDGTDPEFVRNILENKIIANGISGEDSIFGYVIMEGALMVQAGVNPYIIQETFKSMIPNKYTDVIGALINRDICGTEIREIVHGRDAWTGNGACKEETLLLKLFRYWVEYLSDVEIGYVIKNTDTLQLGNVLYHSSRRLRSKFTSLAPESSRFEWISNTDNFAMSNVDADATDILRAIEELRKSYTISSASLNSFITSLNKDFVNSQLPNDLRDRYVAWLASEKEEHSVYISGTVDTGIANKIKDKLLLPTTIERVGIDSIEDAVASEMATHYLFRIDTYNYHNFPVETIYNLAGSRDVKRYIIFGEEECEGLTPEQEDSINYFARFISNSENILLSAEEVVEKLNFIAE